MGSIKLHQLSKTINYVEFYLPLPHRTGTTCTSVITGIEVEIESNHMNAEIIINYSGTIYKRCGMLLSLTPHQTIVIPLDNFPIFGNTKFSIKVSGVICPSVTASYKMNDIESQNDIIITQNTIHDSSNIVYIGKNDFNKWHQINYDSIWEGDSITIVLGKNKLINFEKIKLKIKHLSVNLNEYSEHDVIITKRDFIEHLDFYTCELKMSEKLHPDETLIEYALHVGHIIDELVSCELRFYFPSSGYSSFSHNTVNRIINSSQDKPINLIITKSIQHPIDNIIAEMNLFT